MGIKRLICLGSGSLIGGFVVVVMVSSDSSALSLSLNLKPVIQEVTKPVTQIVSGDTNKGEGSTQPSGSSSGSSSQSSPSSPSSTSSTASSTPQPTTADTPVPVDATLQPKVADITPVRPYTYHLGSTIFLGKGLSVPLSSVATTGNGEAGVLGIQATQEGWKIAGIAWYWWGSLVAILVVMTIYIRKIITYRPFRNYLKK